MGIDKVSIHSSPLGFSSHELTSTPEILMFWGGNKVMVYGTDFQLSAAKKGIRSVAVGP